MLTSDEALEGLEVAINTYFKTLWAEREALNTGDVIPEWVVVIHYTDLETPDEGGYAIQTSKSLPNFGVRGMLHEGLEILNDRRRRDDDE